MTRTHGKAPSKRQLRVGEELRHALSNVLLRGVVRDPSLHDLPITVSEVRVSPDLRNATAYVIPLGGVDTDAVVTGLRRAAPFLRGQIAREVELRIIPALYFEADRSFDQAARIDRLLEADSVRDVAENTPDTEGE